MLVDIAVKTSVYKRPDKFYLPRSFFQSVATQCGGQLLLKDDWSNTLFLCCDGIAISFWLQREGEHPTFTMVSLDLVDLGSDFPELVDMWLWKHIDETWDEVRARCVGSPNLSDYAHWRSLEFAQSLSTYTQHYSGPGRLN